MFVLNQASIVYYISIVDCNLRFTGQSPGELIIMTIIQFSPWIRNVLKQKQNL